MCRKWHTGPRHGVANGWAVGCEPKLGCLENDDISRYRIPVSNRLSTWQCGTLVKWVVLMASPDDDDGVVAADATCGGTVQSGGGSGWGRAPSGDLIGQRAVSVDRVLAIRSAVDVVGEPRTWSLPRRRSPARRRRSSRPRVLVRQEPRRRCRSRHRRSHPPVIILFIVGSLSDVKAPVSCRGLPVPLRITYSNATRRRAAGRESAHHGWVVPTP